MGQLKLAMFSRNGQKCSGIFRIDFYGTVIVVKQKVKFIL